jgi:hypothetical protein
VVTDIRNRSEISVSKCRLLDRIKLAKDYLYNYGNEILTESSNLFGHPIGLVSENKEYVFSMSVCLDIIIFGSTE